MEMQGRFSAKYPHKVVRAMDKPRGSSRCDVSLRGPAWQNISALFSHVEHHLTQWAASPSAIEDCRQNAKDVEGQASHHLGIAIACGRDLAYLRVLDDLIAVSREMLDTATTLSELESVVNWSTSLAIRALSFAMETRDTMNHEVHASQHIEDLDRVWKTPHAKSENWIRREWVYAC